MDTSNDVLKKYLERAKYKVIPVQSEDVSMVAGPDDTLGVYHIIKNFDGSIEKVISQEVDKLCRFRNKLTDLILDTLDDIEVEISLYLFCFGQRTVSSQCHIILSMKGVKLVNLDDLSGSLSNYFPRFKLDKVEKENFDAYVGYLHTVAGFFNKGIEKMYIPKNKYSSPRELSNEVKKYIKGQDDVVESVAIPFFQHMESMRNRTCCEIKGSFIIIGNTGTGKSEMLRRFAELCDVPVIRINTSDCVPSAWTGKHIQDFISSEINDKTDLEKLRYAVLVFNEFDKITHHNTTHVSSKSSDWEKDMQAEFLKFYDKGYELLIQRPIQNGITETYRLATENLLLCFDGAFTGLEQIIDKRTGQDSKIGYAPVPKSSERTSGKLQVVTEDLAKWGYGTELLGRIGTFLVMNPMSEELMVEVLTNASDNILDTHVKECAQYGITLKFSDEAIRTIAHNAIEKKLGFRGIKPLLNEILKPIYYDCDSYTNKTIVLNNQYLKGK